MAKVSVCAAAKVNACAAKVNVAAQHGDHDHHEEGNVDALLGAVNEIHGALVLALVLFLSLVNHDADFDVLMGFAAWEDYVSEMDCGVGMDCDVEEMGCGAWMDCGVEMGCGAEVGCVAAIDFDGEMDFGGANVSVLYLSP